MHTEKIQEPEVVWEVDLVVKLRFLDVNGSLGGGWEVVWAWIATIVFLVSLVF